MYRAGQWVPSTVRRVSWSVAQSMRDVDAECQTYITQQYLNSGVESEPMNLVDEWDEESEL